MAELEPQRGASPVREGLPFKKYPKSVMLDEVLGLKKYVYVAPGLVGISRDGTPLISDGFYDCSAALIQNIRNDRYVLAHVDIEMESSDIEPYLKKLGWGAKRALIFSSGWGYRTSDLARIMLDNYGILGIHSEEVVVDSGSGYWGFVFDPKRDQAYIDTHSVDNPDEKSIETYGGFGSKPQRRR